MFRSKEFVNSNHNSILIQLRTSLSFEIVNPHAAYHQHSHYETWSICPCPFELMSMSMFIWTYERSHGIRYLSSTIEIHYLSENIERFLLDSVTRWPHSQTVYRKRNHTTWQPEQRVGFRRHNPGPVILTLNLDSFLNLGDLQYLHWSHLKCRIRHENLAGSSELCNPGSV